MPLLGLKPFPQGCPQVPILVCRNVRVLVLQGIHFTDCPSKQDAHTNNTALARRFTEPEKPKPMLAHRLERNRKCPNPDLARAQGSRNGPAAADGHDHSEG